MKMKRLILETVVMLMLASSIAVFAGPFGGSGEFGKLKLTFQKLKWSILPKTTKSITLGSASKKFKEAHIVDGYIDSIAGDTAADWQTATDKVLTDSATWDAAAVEVNADSAVWEDKYTKVEVDGFVNDLDTAKYDSTTVDAFINDLDTAKYDSTTVDTLLADKVALADSALVQHNDLLGKQGGTAGEYYHMTAAQHGEIGNWQTATDKIEDDSDYWDLMCDKVNDDSAIWADKYTQAQITAYLALKFDVADSTIFVWKDGSQDFTADQSMGGFTLTHLDEPAADSEPATKYYADQGLAGKQATGNYLEDGDFGSNGLMKRTGAGAYSIVTDNSTYWGQMSDKVASDSPNWDAAYTLKGVLDALNGIMKCDGAGNYSIITDLSTYWTQMSDEVASDSPNWDDAYSKRVVTWTSPLVFSSNTASMPAATNTVNGYMPAAFVIALEQDDVEELTPVNAVASQGTITMSGIATADETFVIDSQTFTWKASRSGAGEVTIGADAPAAVTNIVTAVTADLATVTAVDGDGDTVTVTAVTKGVAGNSLVFTEASTNMVVDGAGTLGTTVAGVDGTVGIANELAADANYLYHCVDTNTIADDNWRRISLGSAY